MDLKDELKKRYKVNASIESKEIKKALSFKKPSFNFAKVLTPLISFVFIFVVVVAIISGTQANSASKEMVYDSSPLEEESYYEIDTKKSIEENNSIKSYEPSQNQSEKSLDKAFVNVFDVKVSSTDTMFHLELDHIDYDSETIYFNKVIDEGNEETKETLYDEQIEVNADTDISDFEIVVNE